MLHLMLVVLLLLNALDAWLTYYGHLRGYLHEANPIWAELIVTSPHTFIVMKSVIVLCSCFLLLYSSKKNNRFAMLAATISVCIYMSVVVFHLLNVL